MHPKPASAPHPAGAIEALVAAERAWHAHLDVVRAEAARLVATARDDAARAEADTGHELAQAVERRRGQLDAELATALAEIARRGVEEAGRYAHASDATVRALAISLVRRAPWLASSEPPREAGR